jgi:hypothetical protein
VSARLEAIAARDAPTERPGRTCPTAYRYSPRTFDRPAEIEADTMYVAGGLYGNVEALEAILVMAAAEPRPAVVVFNGDFHWFDVDAADFARVNGEVLRHHAIRGNVETEIAHEDSGAGCGCAYPLDVSDAEVSRSNEILARLRETSRAFTRERAALDALPMNLVARVGPARVGIVHGDAASLAGWGFAHDALDERSHRRWLESVFADANVDMFASSHTCLPAIRSFSFARRPGVVANNGAAGMPNFRGTRFGLATRISIHRAAGVALYGLRSAGTFVDAMPVRYDAEAWTRRFLANWPESSPAHESYFQRMVAGPNFIAARAAPRTA